ncbi:DUF6336 family protein [Streptomyces marokkonensis]|uniref:DUF6336 family protein n=1 Tax=Streptomyces marokkonensis TaxID=324855 RepID=A0ABW6QF74_9ACTN
MVAVPLLGAAARFVGDHDDRTTFLAVAGGLAAAVAVVGILIGLFFWRAWGRHPALSRLAHRQGPGQAGPVGSLPHPTYRLFASRDPSGVRR